MDQSTNVDISSPEYKTDEFRMFKLKVVECPRRYSHDWTTCPFSHPNEKARRRDPRTFNYTGVACPFIRQNQACAYGDQCPYSHNVFEYWLHPSRYRTQLCNIAASCNRNVCFFAHTIEELRIPLPIGDPDASSAPRQVTLYATSQPQGLGRVSHDSTLAIQAHAKYILNQLLSSMRLSPDSRSASSPMNDLSEIQRLIALLQRQQIVSGVDQTPDLQLAFLDSLLLCLHQEVCSSVLPGPVKERLTKLIDWMYVQLVQNRQSLFESTERPSLLAQANQNPFLADPVAGRLSLSRIPEMTEAALGFVNRTSLDLPLSPSISPGNFIQYPTVCSSWDARSMPNLSLDIMRMSTDSSRTGVLHPTASRSSYDSELLFGHQSRNITSFDSRVSQDDQPPDFILQDLQFRRGGLPPPPSSST